MSIEWHEECLASMVETAKRLEEQMSKAIAESSRCWKECYEYEEQIREAKKRGKDGFDADRFLRPRGK